MRSSELSRQTYCWDAELRSMTRYMDDFSRTSARRHLAVEHAHGRAFLRPCMCMTARHNRLPFARSYERYGKFRAAQNVRGQAWKRWQISSRAALESNEGMA